jgi:glycosyltransferase involved in cell wall biosynthesis
MNSDICIMPSLRDNCPATLLEAMLCRCVPFVVDCNGPGEMVPESTGIKIKPSDPEEMATKFAEALVELSKSRDKLRDLGNAAAEHVMINYTQQHYLATVNRAYAQATNKL